MLRHILPLLACAPAFAAALPAVPRGPLQAGAGPARSAVVGPDAVRLEMLEGRARLIAPDRVAELDRHSERVRLEGVGHLSVRAASQARLTWSGRASLLVDGPAEVEWRPPGAPSGADGERPVPLDRLELTVHAIGALDLEVRRGEVTLLVPGSWRGTLGAAALQLTGRPNGAALARLHAGRPVRFEWVGDSAYVRPPVELVAGSEVHLAQPRFRPLEPLAEARRAPWPAGEAEWPWRVPAESEAQRAERLAAPRRTDRTEGWSGLPVGGSAGLPPTGAGTRASVAVGPVVSHVEVTGPDGTRLWVPIDEHGGDHGGDHGGEPADGAPAASRRGALGTEPTPGTEPAPGPGAAVGPADPLGATAESPAGSPAGSPALPALGERRGRRFRGADAWPSPEELAAADGASGAEAGPRTGRLPVDAPVGAPGEETAGVPAASSGPDAGAAPDAPGAPTSHGEAPPVVPPAVVPPPTVDRPQGAVVAPPVAGAPRGAEPSAEPVGPGSLAQAPEVQRPVNGGAESAGPQPGPQPAPQPAPSAAPAPVAEPSPAEPPASSAPLEPVPADPYVLAAWRGLPRAALQGVGPVAVQRRAGVEVRALSAGRVRVLVDGSVAGPVWCFTPDADLRLAPGATVVFEATGAERMHLGVVERFDAAPGRPRWDALP